MLRKCYQKWVGLIIKIPYLRTLKLSKDWLDHILDIFFNYFNVINVTIPLVRYACKRHANK